MQFVCDQRVVCRNRAAESTGRKPRIDPAAVRRLRDKEKLGPSAIAKRLGIGRASVYRVLGKVAA